MEQTLLAFDVGNSRLKAALYNNGRLLARETMNLAQIWEDCARVLQSSLAAVATPDRCLISSVVRGVDAVISQAVASVWQLMPKVVTADMDLGISVAVPRPDHVGIDRLLEAGEAFQIVGGPVVVAAFGSALTVDLVNGKGVFCGGTIAPGLRLGLRALHDETSLLPDVELQSPDSALGTDTMSCMQAGVVYGAAGAVDRLFEEYLSDDQGQLVLTGGDAELITPFIKTPHRVEPDLVLRALVSLDQRLLSGN